MIALPAYIQAFLQFLVAYEYSIHKNGGAAGIRTRVLDTLTADHYKLFRLRAGDAQHLPLLGGGTSSCRHLHQLVQSNPNLQDQQLFGPG